MLREWDAKCQQADVCLHLARCYPRTGCLEELLNGIEIASCFKLAALLVK